MLSVQQALPQWPNTVSIGIKPAQTVAAQKPRGSRMGRAVAAVRQRTLGSQPQLGDHVQALWTGYKPVSKPDQQLLDRYTSVSCVQLLVQCNFHKRQVSAVSTTPLSISLILCSSASAAKQARPTSQVAVTIAVKLHSCCGNS